MVTVQDQLIRYLQDAHAAEVGITQMLEGFIKEATDNDIRAIFQQHLAVTQSQAQRLEKRLSDYGQTPSRTKGFINSLMASLGDVAHAGHDPFEKTTMDLIKAYATEHLEIGMYTALAGYAQAFGDHTTASLAEEIAGEERKAAETIFPYIRDSAKAPLEMAMQTA
ncbi:MAG TPA: DUF892 family protein [Chthonomonadaceae bacterium]|nr:DUF892 family protein [Chthonomonadaceae bacterium]